MSRSPVLQFLAPKHNVALRWSGRPDGVWLEVEAKGARKTVHLEFGLSREDLRRVVTGLCREGDLPEPWKD